MDLQHIDLEKIILILVAIERVIVYAIKIFTGLKNNQSDTKDN